jgi:hypothetical protein
MRRLLLMSILFIQLILPIWLSNKPAPRRMLPKTLWIIAIYMLFWSLVAPTIYLRYLQE